MYKRQPLNIGERIFYCNPWMISQAQGFIDLLRVMGDLMELEVYGDGLLAWILKTGAELPEAQEMLE